MPPALTTIQLVTAWSALLSLRVATATPDMLLVLVVTVSIIVVITRFTAVVFAVVYQHFILLSSVLASQFRSPLRCSHNFVLTLSRLIAWICRARIVRRMLSHRLH